jgi:hypothetical protein
MGNRYSNVRRGYATDLGDGNHYASGWERDFARFLNHLQQWGVVRGWEYEPQEFSFQGLGYKRGPFIYKPDFVVQFANNVHSNPYPIECLLTEVSPGAVVYIEVKGQETGRDRNKWRRFRKHTGYPLEIVKRDKMIRIQNACKRYIPDWESNVY